MASRFDGNVETLKEARRRLCPPLVQAAELIGQCLAGGSKMLLCGTGFAAVDAQYLAGIFLDRFGEWCEARLPVIVLDENQPASRREADSWADEHYSRQVQAFGAAGDVLFGLCLVLQL